MRLTAYLSGNNEEFWKYLTEITKAEKSIRDKYRGTAMEDIPLEDLWVSMDKGNKKLAKNITTFNLPAIKSCPNSKDCAKFCYAKKAERIYPSARISRERNFRLAKENLQLLKAKILKNLRKGDIVRIHESGDFFSQEYLDMWYEVMKERQDVMFYAYTKTEAMWDFSKVKALENFSLVPSIIAGKINFGPEHEINIRAEELGLPVCPCKKGNDVKCGIDCKMCMDKNIGPNGVLFVQH
jgi:hypothetical protein